MDPTSRRGLTALLAFALLAPALLSGCAEGSRPGVLRLGYFPNLTHAQPLYGIQSGLYQEKMGDTVLETITFNAGPSAFEALNAGSVDVIYVGPSPTLNALARTGSDYVRIIAGSATGGAAFVVRDGVRLDSDADLAGKRFATPQPGNTQDIALKHWMLGKGHKPTDKGGEVEVVYAQNSDILAMLQNGQVDGAWVPEPWATRLQLEGGGKVHIDEAELWGATEGKYVTTQVVTTRAYLASHATEVGRFLDAHVAATRRLQEADAEAQRVINDAILDLTGKPLGEETLRRAIANVGFTSEPLTAAMEILADWSRDLGFEAPEDPTNAYDLGPLEAALARAGPA